MLLNNHVYPQPLEHKKTPGKFLKYDPGDESVVQIKSCPPLLFWENLIRNTDKSAENY